MNLCRSFAAQHSAMKKVTMPSDASSEEADQPSDDQTSVKELMAVQGVYFKCPLIGECSSKC